MVLSLQLAHRLNNKNVLLVGGGEVALTRVEKLVITGCKITLIANDIHEDILERYAPFCLDNDSKDIINPEWEKTHPTEVYRVIRTPFEDKHFHLYQNPDGSSVDSNWAMILTCIPDRAVSESIYLESKKLFGNQQLVNVADNPPYCDFYFGANLNIPATDLSTQGKESLLQLLISSNGASPRFTALIRDEIDEFLRQFDIEDSVLKLGELRKQIRLQSNKYVEEDNDDHLAVLKYRMQWIKKCTDIFGLQNCSRMNTEKLLTLYDKMYRDEKSTVFPDSDEMLREYAITGSK
ncbi:hypothetical protein TPHA_0F02830 [Tetrapisispora phaffii CBS 4417]|uniref:precorrin-2 dehydrogenase n=1 Tax=Tetrapisispora phaffii (strain ATCC 24235 / CBS 4417 / NBRC 1672 / NRRL Y-8282 / UCD 70-5) TaxID=1071381 RepID=G8BUH8_TETPH|nr:hypothetical protein TPHA_0F02830 [Tetrapisispora phaffii CBS 4417]CCE63764.1 hypothetical protein TPHA_0F02830 [Tetrapisispora phaffii CBS 4417]